VKGQEINVLNKEIEKLKARMESYMKECTELKLNEEKFQDQLETQRMDMEKN